MFFGPDGIYFLVAAGACVGTYRPAAATVDILAAARRHWYDKGCL
jgi:hypothetical protein